MLLELILNNTWKWHPDYTNLKIALQKVETVMLLLNDRKRDFQNQQQMIIVEQSLDGNHDNAGIVDTFRWKNYLSSS
jgi:hypothetical protein